MFYWVEDEFDKHRLKNMFATYEIAQTHRETESLKNIQSPSVYIFSVVVLCGSTVYPVYVLTGCKATAKICKNDIVYHRAYSVHVTARAGRTSRRSRIPLAISILREKPFDYRDGYLAAGYGVYRTWRQRSFPARKWVTRGHTANLLLRRVILSHYYILC